MPRYFVVARVAISVRVRLSSSNWPAPRRVRASWRAARRPWQSVQGGPAGSRIYAVTGRRIGSNFWLPLSSVVKMPGAIPACVIVPQQPEQFCRSSPAIRSPVATPGRAYWPDGCPVRPHAGHVSGLQMTWAPFATMRGTQGRCRPVPDSPRLHLRSTVPLAAAAWWQAGSGITESRRRQAPVPRRLLARQCKAAASR